MAVTAEFRRQGWRCLISALTALPLIVSAACVTVRPVSGGSSSKTTGQGTPAVRQTATRPPPAATATALPVLGSPPAAETGVTQFTPAPTQLTSLWVDPAFPGQITLPQTFTLTQSQETAVLSLTMGSEPPASEWIYALVAPFFEKRDGVSGDELQRLWSGEATGALGSVSLLVAPQTADILSRLWGRAPGSKVEIIPADSILESAWVRPAAWSIIPFEAVQPRWKVLAVDGQSPIHSDFHPAVYPLVVYFSLQGPAQHLKELTTGELPTSNALNWPITNRDRERLTILTMSGVTALVRATAWTMERQGLTYPARDIGQWLRQADITHISNEVPFVSECPYPDPGQQGVTFCSDPKYIALLEDVGTDVVELTGDHFHDWGAEAMLYTLELYEERGWLTYGGGRNYEQAIQPVFIENHGNRLAFIGCNAKGGAFARASATTPGSAACDLDWMRRQVTQLSQQGYLVIATFQHAEYYSYAIPAALRPDFRAMAEAGAVIVSGSQAHQPHGFEFWAGGFIHYGLGNLFFDQYGVSQATQQGVIDRHVFYDGRYLGVELLTYRFEDYARARPMDSSERQSLLTNLFDASGW